MVSKIYDFRNHIISTLTRWPKVAPLNPPLADAIGKKTVPGSIFKQQFDEREGMKMARPKKMSEKLSHQISFRLTVPEHNAYMQKVLASGLTSSDFFRDAVLKNRTTINAVAHLTDEKRELIRYFRATSNNINQIARRCNLDNKKGILNDTSYTTLLQSLQRIEAALKAGAVNDH